MSFGRKGSCSCAPALGRRRGAGAEGRLAAGCGVGVAEVLCDQLSVCAGQLLASDGGSQDGGPSARWIAVTFWGAQLRTKLSRRCGARLGWQWNSGSVAAAPPPLPH